MQADMRDVVQVVEPQQSSQQHKQLQPPMQQQQQQPQATPQQHEEELVDTTDAVMERQHRTAQQYQGPNPNNMNWYSMDRTHPTKRRKGERPAERAQATSEEEAKRKAVRSKYGRGLVSKGLVNGTQAAHRAHRAQAEPVEPVAGVARAAGGDRNGGESGGLDDSEGQRRVEVTEPCAQDL